MHRLRQNYSTEAIEAAYRVIPDGVRARLPDIDWFVDTDPNWAGLHSYKDSVRPFSSTAHTVYVENQFILPRNLRHPTIVLFRDSLKQIATAVHEIGHILHQVLKFEPTPLPVSDYAASNKYEAFACAFDTWILPNDKNWLKDPTKLWEDEKTMRLFEELSR